MRLPCAKPLAFIVTGPSFLKPGLTNIQFDNMTLVATALVLGSVIYMSGSVSYFHHFIVKEPGRSGVRAAPAEQYCRL